MDPVERLVAVEEIKALKARFCRAMDTADWALLEETLTPDATYRRSGAGGVEETLEGRAAIVAMIRASMAGVSASHRVLMPEIEVEDERRAIGHWVQIGVVRAGAAGPITLESGGYSVDRYERVGDRWATSAVHLQRDYLIRTAPEPADRPLKSEVRS
jgi:hypothetical protein